MSAFTRNILEQILDYFQQASLIEKTARIKTNNPGQWPGSSAVL